MIKRSVWRDAPEVSQYVPRCSVCGKFQRRLKEHWFFSGLYCMECIQDILYDNARNIAEVSHGTGNV